MKKTKSIKTWYRASLPCGEITTLTVDEAKAHIDRYLTGECDEFNNGNYSLSQQNVRIYKHTSTGKITLVWQREYCERWQLEDYPEKKPDIDYGVLGYFTKWEEII